MDNKFTFGKYAGRTFDEVLDTDATYIAWCLDNDLLNSKEVSHINNLIAKERILDHAASKKAAQDDFFAHVKDLEIDPEADFTYTLGVHTN